jgi:hypothetical protein
MTLFLTALVFVFVFGLSYLIEHYVVQYNNRRNELYTQQWLKDGLTLKEVERFLED